MPGKMITESRTKTFLFWACWIVVMVSSLVTLYLWTANRNQNEQLKVQDAQLARQSVAIRAQSVQNKRTILYLCKTSDAFATVLVQAAGSATVNLKTGVYSRLVANGTLQPSDVEQVKKSIRVYTRTAKDLRRPNNPCEDLKK